MSERYRKFNLEYKNKLFSYLVCKSRDAEVAQDSMVESFTRHYQHYGHEAVISPALLFTIARNAMVDQQRNNGRFQRVEHAVFQITGEEESFIAREETARVQEAFSRLPEQDREMLTLIVNGVDFRGIAAIFNLRVANVKVWVHRIRTRLQPMLSARGNNGSFHQPVYRRRAFFGRENPVL